MPVIGGPVDRQEYLEIFARRDNVVRDKSKWFSRESIEDYVGENWEYLLYPGMILGESDGHLVPYNSGAAYGTGSDTATGVLGQMIDVGLSDQGVAQVIHAQLIEANCYVFGSDIGDISNAIKTDLTMIQWV